MIITVFRSRLQEDGKTAYFELAPKMSELAKSMPGYISHKAFTAEDGERVTIVEFKDEASQTAWSQQVDHVAAKKQGRQAFYAEYKLQVCSLLKESVFKRTSD